MQNLDWPNLGFTYRDVNAHIKSVWSKGRWSTPEVVPGEPYLKIHIAATALHYGQTAFEGLKAFRGKDGLIRIFRPDANCARMVSSAERTEMAVVPEELFIKACKMAVEANLDFLPPYGNGASMYLRPLLIGTGPRMGVQPADEYTFIVIAVPVGAYYKGGLQMVDAMIVDGYDRAAPMGTGNVKVGGNYAAGLKPYHIAKDAGFPVNLYLDAKEHRYIDEFGTSNFVGIQDDTYITPSSPTILPSVTNKALIQLATDLGMKTIRRPVEAAEIKDFEGIAACGTAVVLNPINRIVTASGTELYKSNGQVHPRFEQLYRALQAIQYGEAPDKHGWCVAVKG